MFPSQKSAEFPFQWKKKKKRYVNFLFSFEIKMGDFPGKSTTTYKLEESYIQKKLEIDAILAL